MGSIWATWLGEPSLSRVPMHMSCPMLITSVLYRVRRENIRPDKFLDNMEADEWQNSWIETRGCKIRLSLFSRDMIPHSTLVKLMPASGARALDERTETGYWNSK